MSIKYKPKKSLTNFNQDDSDLFSEAENIDWENLDFKLFDFDQQEIEIIIENFGNLLKTKQLSYLKRKINYQGYKELTTAQRYYRNNRETIINKVTTWQQDNREEYLQHKREYNRKKREQERLAKGKTKSNRGRPRIQ